MAIAPAQRAAAGCRRPIATNATAAVCCSTAGAFVRLTVFVTPAAASAAGRFFSALGGEPRHKPARRFFPHAVPPLERKYRMSPLPRRKPSRSELPSGANLCEYCTAKCCHYFALPIDEPTTRRDFDYIRWYLLHPGATVFVEDGTWYLLVYSACKHLQTDHRCGIYESRPQICRDYKTTNCEYEDEWVYERYFETPEQVEEYVEVAHPRRGRDIRSPRPPLLPVLAVAGGD